MALVIGSENADSGMGLAIYQEMDRLLSPPLQAAVDAAEGEAEAKAREALDKAREGWRKLSFAIANGVIGHLLANLEVRGIKTRGQVQTTVAGSTAPADPGSHLHAVNLSGTAANVEFTQSNDGLGRIR